METKSVHNSGITSRKKARRVRYDEIRKLYFIQELSMDQIVTALSTPERKISKHTVFRAIHERSKLKNKSE